MNQLELTAIPGIGKRRADVMARRLGIHSLLDLVLADRELIRQALSSGRTPSPTIEEIGGWQDHARRRRLRQDREGEWRRAASFVVAFEEGQAAAGPPTRQLVIEQAEAGPEPDVVVLDRWDCDAMESWIRERLPEGPHPMSEDSAGSPENAEEPDAMNPLHHADGVRITGVTVPGVAVEPSDDGSIVLPQPAVLTVALDPAGASSVEVSVALIDASTRRIARVLGSATADDGTAMIQVDGLDPGMHRLMVFAADAGAGTAPGWMPLEARVVASVAPTRMERRRHRNRGFSKHLPPDPVTALPAADAAFPPTRAEVREGSYPLTAGIADPGVTEPVTPIPPPPAGDALHAELLELYWMALLRDVPLADLPRAPDFALARGELAEHGIGDPFEGLPTTHPHSVSPLLLDPVRYGKGVSFELRVVDAPAGAFGTTLADAARMQMGSGGPAPEAGPPWRPPASGGDLAHLVWDEPLLLQWLHALQRMWGVVAVTSPLKGRRARLLPFARYAPSEITSCVAQVVHRALLEAMEHKWVHRRSRPEELAIRAENDRGSGSWADGLARTSAGARLMERWGTILLPQMYPEGCPPHPSYPAGHATAAGAAATIMKMLFEDGPLPGVKGWTVYDALDRLAINIAAGRAWAGVHFRADNLAGLRLGEVVAERLAPDLLADWPPLEWRRFDGRHEVTGHVS